MHGNSFIGAWAFAPDDDSQVHQRIVMALRWWTLTFLCLWMPLAVLLSYGLQGISLDKSSPPWVTMILFQGLALLTAASFAADVLVRLRNQDFSVLYLRKFRSEEREAFPINPFDEHSGLAPDSLRRQQRFRLASMLEGIGLLGVRVIALRDARTPGSSHVILYLLPVYLLLMLFAPAMLLLFVCWAVSVWVAATAGVGAEHWGALLAAELLALVCLITIWPQAQMWLRVSMELHSETVRGILIRGFRPGSAEELDRLVARARSVGPVAVRSSDLNWETFVDRLLRSTDMTLFDVRASSANCERELELIRELRLQERVIWLVSELSDVIQEGTTYRVGAIVFPSRPNLLAIPRNLPRPAPWHPVNLSHVQFLSTLIAAMDRVRRTEHASS